MKVGVPVYPQQFFFRIQNRLKISMKSSPRFGPVDMQEIGLIAVQSFKNKV